GQKRTRKRAALEQRSVIIEAAVDVFGIALDQLCADQSAIGLAVIDSEARLGHALDEELSGLVGILRRHGDAIAFLAVARCDPAKSALHDRCVSDDTVNLVLGSRRHYERPTMAEHDKHPVPLLR